MIYYELKVQRKKSYLERSKILQHKAIKWQCAASWKQEPSYDASTQFSTPITCSVSNIPSRRIVQCFSTSAFQEQNETNYQQAPSKSAVNCIPFSAKPPANPSHCHRCQQPKLKSSRQHSKCSSREFDKSWETHCPPQTIRPPPLCAPASLSTSGGGLPAPWSSPRLFPGSSKSRQPPRHPTVFLIQEYSLY
jgi:hypothetical protein